MLAEHLLVKLGEVDLAAGAYLEAADAINSALRFIRNIRIGILVESNDVEWTGRLAGAASHTQFGLNDFIYNVRVGRSVLFVSPSSCGSS